MATRVAKTTSTAAKKVEKVEEEIVVEKPVKEKTVKVAPAHPDYVLCHSTIPGGLHITCRSGNSYDFLRYGQENEIEYHDLVALVRKHSDHIFNPRIVIDDEVFLDEFPQIRKVYEDMYTNEDLLNILNGSVQEMEIGLSELPKSLHSFMCNIISTEIANGHLDSVRKIRILSDFFDSDFNLLSELFSK